jgi:CheY-like chemotaxis protein
MTMLKLIHLEDDKQCAELIKRALEGEFGKSTVEIKRICTEAAFRAQIPQIVEDNPDCVLLDVMVRWTDVSRDMPAAPEEVKEEGNFRAGLRCERLLHEVAPDLPTILYTVLDRKDLGEEILNHPKVRHITKEANFAPLFDAIRENTRSGDRA